MATCGPFEFLHDVAGNVVCFVPNGAKAVKLVERWVECRPGQLLQEMEEL